MRLLNYIVLSIAYTLLRVFPFPCKTGVIKIGNPDKNSLVFLTCNYHLTVERVKRALKGVDAYLLVANSRGINVWCAATGGLFTNHDVISILKTSGIEELVDHRNLILPQLAATGIEATVIRKKTGWKVIWGSVYAKDIPFFIENGLRKTLEMREVEFPWTQRLEMAVAWAFPVSFVSALIIIPFWREAVFPLMSLTWGLSLLIFVSFPLYSRWLNSKGERVGFVFFDFGRGGLQLILWGALVLGLVGYYKSGLHEDRLLKVILDGKKCRGAGFCEQVCPSNCYEVDRDRHIATIARTDRCVQCGACVVQCPFDALYFKSPKGEIVSPETIRKFKLNLMGRRLVKVERK